MVSSLRNVSEELAVAVADGLGIDLPSPMPRALETVPAAEIMSSPALSLFALSGDGGIATRKIAILVANGIEGESITEVMEALTEAGAVVRLLGSRLGTVTSESGETFEVDATLENSPAVLFDALVLPDGSEAIDALVKDGHTLDFVKNQYRHCKTILALGASAMLLEQLRIPAELPSGEPDSGLLIGTWGEGGAGADAFIAAVGKHRHPARDVDPPSI